MKGYIGVALISIILTQPIFGHGEMYFLFYDPFTETSSPCYYGYEKWLKRFKKAGCWYTHNTLKMKVYTCYHTQILITKKRKRCLKVCDDIQRVVCQDQRVCSYAWHAGEGVMKYLYKGHGNVKW